VGGGLGRRGRAHGLPAGGWRVPAATRPGVLGGGVLGLDGEGAAGPPGAAPAAVASGAQASSRIAINDLDPRTP